MRSTAKLQYIVELVGSYRQGGVMDASIDEILLPPGHSRRAAPVRSSSCSSRQLLWSEPDSSPESDRHDIPRTEITMTILAALPIISSGNRVLWNQAHPSW